MMARPLSKDWMETEPAADYLGLTARQLRKLRQQQLFKPGTHYRVKNPLMSRSQYLWNVARIAPLLAPEELEQPGDRSD